MNALLSFVISIILGGLLAFATARWDKKERALGGIIGLVVVCLGSLVAIYFEMRQLRADQTETLRGAVPILKSDVWRAVVQDISDYDHQEPDNNFMVILEDPVRRNIETSLNQATSGTINVEDKGDVVRITSELMEQARSSVEATSFIDPSEWWKSSIGDNYLTDIRNTKKHVSTFTRIFIFGSTNEARLLAPILKGQHDIGIDVRYACATNIPPQMRRDFIVIDRMVAADLTLDEARHFQRATFYSTRHNAEVFDRDFHDLLYYTTPYDQHIELHCSALPADVPGRAGDLTSENP
jgi:hypothetical protein